MEQTLENILSARMHVPYLDKRLGALVFFFLKITGSKITILNILIYLPVTYISFANSGCNCKVCKKSSLWKVITIDFNNQHTYKSFDFVIIKQNFPFIIFFVYLKRVTQFFPLFDLFTLYSGLYILLSINSFGYFFDAKHIYQ